MNSLTDFYSPLIDVGKTFYKKGWLMGTSGNFSRRFNPNTFFITKSGVDKGNLCSDDFTRIVDGKSTWDDKPSAETCIHTTIYQLFEDARAIYHVHDPYAALVGRRDLEAGETKLKGWEMIKGLGVWEDVEICIPILFNHSNVENIADAIVSLFRTRDPQVPLINIAGHGVYAWGNSPAEAKRHLESASYLFKVDYLEKANS